jgi:tyrosine-protein phosphatase YwqE
MFSLFNRQKLTDCFPENYIDFHNHLLPNIDDGSKGFDESFSLIKRLSSYGIKNFVCSPHIMESVWENTPEIINTKLFELQDYLKKQGVTDVKIRAAAEYMMDPHFEKLLKSEKLLTIKDDYILIEMSFMQAPLNLYDILFNIQIAGYKPILAHPERYSFLQNNFEEYYKLKHAGCKFQLNLLSLSNYYGPEATKTSKKLLKNNLIDFTASDTHNMRYLDFLESINNTQLINLIKPILENNALLL